MSAGERNYHIFYQLLTDDSIREKWNLPTADKLSYLSCEGQVATIEEMNDTKEFVSVVHALGVFNFRLSSTPSTTHCPPYLPACHHHSHTPFAFATVQRRGDR